MSENPLNVSSVCEVPEADIAVYPSSAMSNHTNSTNLCRLDLDSVNSCVLANGRRRCGKSRAYESWEMLRGMLRNHCGYHDVHANTKWDFGVVQMSQIMSNR